MVYISFNCASSSSFLDKSLFSAPSDSLKHPTKNEFLEYLDDLLKQPQAQLVTTHLDQCRQCRLTVEQLMNETDKVLGISRDNSELNPATDSPPEFEYGNRFLVQEELARGGMGIVYRGFDRELQRVVAIKVSRGEKRTASSARFYREAKISGQLQHPGVVPVYESGRTKDDRLYIAMKLVDGRTLRELIVKDEKNLSELLDSFGSVCQTMAYAHSKNIIHRDLKPENIMVGTFGEVQIMDWGLAKKLSFDELALPDDQGPDESNPGPSPEIQISDSVNRGSDLESGCDLIDPISPGQTQSGQVFGTPAFMPPEQARGEASDKRADVFALGGILHQILTGNPPFSAPTSTMALARSLNSDLEKTHADLEASGADAELITIVKSCLAADPQDRPEDAREVSRKYCDYVSNRDERLELARLEQARASVRLVAQRKRNRQIIGFSAAIITALLVAAAAGFLYFSEKNARVTNQARLDREQLQQQIGIENKVRQGMADAVRFQSLANLESSSGNNKNWDQAVLAIEKADPLAEQLSNRSLQNEFQEMQQKILAAASANSTKRERLLQEQICNEEIYACCVDATNFFQIRHHFDITVLERFESAFEKIGVTPGDLSDEVVSRLKNSKYKDEFVVGLQSWGMEIHLEKFASPASIWARPRDGETPIVHWLQELIARVDDDSFRKQLRGNINRGSVEKARQWLKSDEAVSSLANIRLCNELLGHLPEKDTRQAYYTRAHEKFPDDFFINWQLATSGYTTDAIRIQYTLACYSLQPDHPTNMLNLGSTYLEQGNYNRAIEIYKRLALMAPRLPSVQHGLASCYLKLEKLDLALQHADQFVALTNSEDPELLAFRAKINRMRGDDEAALSDLTLAVELDDPNKEVAYSRLAEMYRDFGELEKSIKLIRLAYELNPEGYLYPVRILENLKRLTQRHVKNQEFEEAIDVCLRAIEVKPEPELQLQLGDLYVLANKLESAEETFQAILGKGKANTNNDNAHCFASIAEINLLRNDPKQSEKSLRKAIARGINSKEMQFQLAKALAKQATDSDPAKKQEAISILKHLVEPATEFKPARALLEILEKK